MEEGPGDWWMEEGHIDRWMEEGHGDWWRRVMERGGRGSWR